MGFDVVERMGVLQRERGRLDHLLATDENWCALLQLEALEAEGQPLSEVDAGALKAVLLKTLEASRIYRARRAILEAIAILNEGFGPIPVLKAPELSAAMPIEADQITAQLTAPEPAASEPVAHPLPVATVMHVAPLAAFPVEAAPPADPVRAPPGDDTATHDSAACAEHEPAAVHCEAAAGDAAQPEPLAANENGAHAAVSIVHAIIVAPAITADAEYENDHADDGAAVAAAPIATDDDAGDHDFGSDAIGIFIIADEATSPEIPASIEVSPAPEPAASVPVKHPIAAHVSNLEHELPLVPDPEEAAVTIVSTRVPVLAVVQTEPPIASPLADAIARDAEADSATLGLTTARPQFTEATVEIVRPGGEHKAPLPPPANNQTGTGPRPPLSENASRFLRALNGT